MNYKPVIKEKYADSRGKVSTYDDVEDLNDQQFIVHVPSINAAQHKHSEERTADKEVPLSSEEQALHDELRRIALEKGKESANSTLTLSTTNTPSQRTGNTPTGFFDVDSDDDVPKDGVFFTNSFDDENTNNEEDGVLDYNNMDPTIDGLSNKKKSLKKVLSGPTSSIAVFYVMDVKSAFLYGNITEEVYVKQPLGFEDPAHPNKPASTPIEAHKSLGKDAEGKDVDVHLYSQLQRLHMHAVKKDFRRSTVMEDANILEEELVFLGYSISKSSINEVAIIFANGKLEKQDFDFIENHIRVDHYSDDAAVLTFSKAKCSQTFRGKIMDLWTLYALNREVRRLKKQTISQAKQIHKLKAKLKKLSKEGKANEQVKSAETEQVHELKKKMILLSVKSRITKELDLDRISNVLLDKNISSSREADDQDAEIILTDAEQRRPTIKKLEVKQVEFKLGEDCWEKQVNRYVSNYLVTVTHIAPIPPGIVEADFDPDDDTSSDDDDFEDIEYISLEEVEQEEKEFDLEDIFQVQDVILREKLLNVHRLISNIKSLKVNSTPDRVLESPSPFPIPVVDSDAFFEESDTSFSHLDNSLPEFETFSDHSEETRSGNTTTHANYSLPEYESFYFDNPSIPRPPPEPPDIEKYLPFISSIVSFENEDTIFDPGIITFHNPAAVSMKVSIYSP
ncbi:reverse transcriptase domain-containing protein [Tanacetum coccineum]|uniref:Reverse transcriptase domain-containing protein n=1 Tax=Tanacetum coccineum TaxID=301880 RepID=A0ABQ4ZWQ0_9ASTR